MNRNTDIHKEFFATGNTYFDALLWIVSSEFYLRSKDTHILSSKGNINKLQAGQ